MNHLSRRAFTSMSVFTPVVCGRKTAPLTFTVRDDFTTPQANPLTTPRTCEPGPGSMVITDPSGKLSIGDGALAMGGTGSYSAPNYTAPSAVSGNVSGRALLAEVTRRAATCGVTFGWGAVSKFDPGMRLLNNSIDACVSSSVVISGLEFPNTLDLARRLAVISRADGSHLLVKDGAAWHLLYTIRTLVGSAKYGLSCYQNADHQAQVNTFRLVDLPSPWNSDYGIAAQHTAAPAAPQAFNHAAEFVFEVTWTPQAGETLCIEFNRADADNLWRLECVQATNFLHLVERNAGVETYRSSAARGLSVGTPARIVVKRFGNTIKTYQDDTALNSYTSAAFNKTVTGGLVYGFAAAAHLVAWPYQIPAGAAAVLDAAMG